jgi:hypothetical protein
MQYVLCSALHYADRSSTRASQPQASGSCRARTRGTGHWAGGAMQGADGHALRRGDQVCVNSPGLVGVLGTIVALLDPAAGWCTIKLATGKTQKLRAANLSAPKRET